MKDEPPTVLARDHPGLGLEHEDIDTYTVVEPAIPAARSTEGKRKRDMLSVKMFERRESIRNHNFMWD
jgi:hypothetical protein